MKIVKNDDEKVLIPSADSESESIASLHFLFVEKI